LRLEIYAAYARNSTAALQIAHQRLVMAQIPNVLPLPAIATEITETIQIPTEIGTLLNNAHRA